MTAHGFRVALLSMTCLAVAATVAAQDVERIRALYVSAAYEEALAIMPSAGQGPASPDVEPYRALCLLALGREPEAVASVERLVRANPTYLPPAGETSPRLQAIVASVRERVVPELVKETYSAARRAYEAGEFPEAEAGFRRTLDLIQSLPATEQEARADLRLLASEFLALTTERPAPPEPAAPEAAPASPPATAAAYEAPTVIREQLPAWNPPDGLAEQRQFVGVLRVRIGPDGHVQSARMVQGSHPVYDSALLLAAKGWLYKPATRGGDPVEAERDIQIRLVPR